MDPKLLAAAQRLMKVLQTENKCVVFAESCTAGRIAATLGVLPGISKFLCGGWVVYRNESKAQWLGIDRSMLDDPTMGPVSPQVSQRLAESCLEHAQEADVACAITGDIGPNAAAQTDGQIFCHFLDRSSGRSVSVPLRLSHPAPRDVDDFAGRNTRLDEATLLAIEGLTEFLTKPKT